VVPGDFCVIECFGGGPIGKGNDLELSGSIEFEIDRRGDEKPVRNARHIPEESSTALSFTDRTPHRFTRFAHGGDHPDTGDHDRLIAGVKAQQGAEMYGEESKRDKGKWRLLPASVPISAGAGMYRISVIYGTATATQRLLFCRKFCFAVDLDKSSNRVLAPTVERIVL
jgi:hypothetical protein